MSQTQVLARKWRPRRFSELTGQDHVVRALTNALQQKRLHHAYLFTGTRGIGKTTVARILAKALNCQTEVTASPCGVCAACTEIDGGRFVDLIELDAASNTQVEKMRELLENALYVPTVARYKVYIIDEVHMLSKSAFNAMLKTLEEPPEHVKFILATTDPQKIPVTVLSRCLQFNLKQIPASSIIAHLRHVLEQEQVGFDAGSLPLLAHAAQGSMRDALSILEQAIAFGGGRIEEKVVRDMLGAVDQGCLLDLMDALAKKDGTGMLAIADEMEARSFSFEAALQDLATLLHRLALAQIVPSAISEDMPERERVFGLARTFLPEDIQLFYQIAIQGRDDLSRAPDEYAGFTMALLRMLAFLPEDLPDVPAVSRPGGKKGTEVISGSESSGKPANPEKSRGARGGTASPGDVTREREDTLAGADESVDAVPSTPFVPSAPVTGAPAEKESNPVAQSDPAMDSLNNRWAALVSELKLNGMPRMLAQHCRIKSFSADEIELCIPELHRHLLDKSYRERLQAALEKHLNKPVKLKFSVGAIVGMSPAELEDREKQEKQSQAVAAIESDPFVRELVEQFDAKLDISSIKPIQ